MKFLNKIQALTFIIIFISPILTYAGNPAPIFDKPVKLDSSGRPVYNPWERREEFRKRPMPSQDNNRPQQWKRPIRRPYDNDKFLPVDRPRQNQPNQYIPVDRPDRL